LQHQRAARTVQAQLAKIVQHAARLVTLLVATRELLGLYLKNFVKGEQWLLVFSGSLHLCLQKHWESQHRSADDFY
jgi:hypothetical protein